LKRVYSIKLQYRSIVKVQPLQLQLVFQSNKATSCSHYLESSTVDKQLVCALLRGKGSCSLALCFRSSGGEC